MSGTYCLWNLFNQDTIESGVHLYSGTSFIYRTLLNYVPDKSVLMEGTALDKEEEEEEVSGSRVR